jgi:hypothetical protein
MKRVYLAPNHLPKDHATFLAACSPEERIVHQMAIKTLASSYFMEKSHGYISWKQNNEIKMEKERQFVNPKTAVRYTLQEGKEQSVIVK